MKCKNCGSNFKENVQFCTVCGRPMEQNNGTGSAKIVIISVAATLIVCIAVFLAWNLLKGDQEEELQASAGNGETNYEQPAESSGYEVQEDPYIVQEPDQAPNIEGSYSYAGNDYEYVIADSDTRYLSKGELATLSDDELIYARNEIYARRGRIFKDKDLRMYFSSKSWYSGYIEPEEFSESMLSDVERHNVQLIVEEEEARD